MKRVVFSFDDKSYNDLKTLQRQLELETMGEALQYSLSLTKSIVDNRIEEGYTRLTLENPVTKYTKKQQGSGNAS